MHNNKLIDLGLWVLLIIGFLGGLSISYSNITGAPCPHLAFIPICYVVTFAYGLMIASVIIRHNGCKHYFFSAGWGVAFIIALTGSIAELLAGGGVCPASGGGMRSASSYSIPMCYLSLAMLVIILALFLLGPYKRACMVCNGE